MRTSLRSTKGAAALLVALSLLAAIPVAPAAGASKRACRVTNTTTDAVFTSFSTALQEADDGQALTVRGICRGTGYVADDVTISGVRPTKRYPVPTLDGNGEGSTVTVLSGTNVTIRKLTITGGTGADNGGTQGGGVRNLGTLLLRSVKVTGNTADWGGGIFNNGTLTIDGASRVTGNHGYQGGGIDDRATLTIGGTTRVEGNAADRYPADPLSTGGGIRAAAGATVTLHDSTLITGNSSPFDGGGIALAGGATLSTDGSVIVSLNTAGRNGGGIASPGATATLAGATAVQGNSATQYGGGVYLYGSAALTLSGSATIASNSASGSGGGIANIGGTVTGAGASPAAGYCDGATINVSGNSPDQCW